MFNACFVNPMNPSYEYSGARFLDLWVRTERALYQSMQQPDSESIRAVLSHFRVSRGFARIAESKVGNGVALLLAEHSKYVTPKTVASRVSDLASSSKFGNKSHHNISAASKLLWMSCRAPFVIYDSRALGALQRENSSLESGDYHAYYRAWRDAYESKLRSITVTNRRNRVHLTKRHLKKRSARAAK